MGKVRILSQHVADRIAAGEVVERPASVVRELLDNAIDAGALRIEIEAENGGIDSVVVADDGSGLARDDAVTAFERHATSKIADGDDLDAIETLGFRGEALAAIAAVSRVEMLTRDESSSNGVRVVLDRGRMLAVDPAPRARGTTLAVRDLFAGIPARRKFLKTTATEIDHIQRVVHRAALARQDIGFRLKHGGRTLLAAAPTPRRQERIRDVLGSRWGKDLLPASDVAGEIRVEAWLGRADLHRPTREGIHLYVNQRPVRDALLMRAVSDAYKAVLPAGRFPVVVLFLDVPASDVDVNVHPAKSEVRFHRPRDVRAVVVSAIERRLGTRQAMPFFAASAKERVPARFEPKSEVSQGARSPIPHTEWPKRPESASSEARSSRVPYAGGHSLEVPAETLPRVLAQYKNTYIIVEDESGLVVVDQHVAHERVLYEKLIHQSESEHLASQTLLFPGNVETDREGMELIEGHGDELSRLGFDLEAVGETTVLVRQVPAVLGRQARPEMLTTLIEDLRRGDDARIGSLFHRLLATVACHSAVRAGMPLVAEKMSYIVRGLRKCKTTTHCPHGRVIALDIDLRELYKGFDRC